MNMSLGTEMGISLSGDQKSTEHHAEHVAARLATPVPRLALGNLPLLDPEEGAIGEDAPVVLIHRRFHVIKIDALEGFGEVEIPRFAIKAQPGATLLEISRINNVPIASVCGGRARCSTCRQASATPRSRSPGRG